MSFFSSLKNKFRDSLYNIVEREGNFNLQFFADLIRGTNTKQSAKHRSKNNHDNRKGIAQEEIITRKRKDNDKKRDAKISNEVEKRKQAMQIHKIKQAKYTSRSR